MALIYQIYSNQQRLKLHDQAKRYLFPYGVVGVEKWLNDFNLIDNNFKNLFFRNLSSDFMEYKRAAAGSQFVIDIDYGKYLDKIKAIVAKLESLALEVEHLQRYKSTLNIHKVIPNFKWILISGLILVAIGVLIPLVILSLVGAENSAPISITLPFIAIVGVCIVSFVLTISYGLRTSREAYTNGVYAAILQSVIGEDAKEHILRQDLLLINDYINNYEKYHLDNSIVDKLVEYRDAAIVSNECAEKRLLSIVRNLSKGPILGNYAGRYKNSEGIKWLNLYGFLDAKKYERFIKYVSDREGRWACVNASMQGSSVEICFEIPSDKQDRQYMVQKFEEIREKMQNNIEIKDCLKLIRETVNLKNKLNSILKTYSEYIQ